ncbi:MAG TPA: hypothetical protein VKD69_22220 [Vicinamibacterales bacterium]|nr:hypothetical protein [Vicinamibacterales bacterium]
MRRWLIACSAAMLALSFAGTAHADEWNKLTYLTFSGPVQLPGVTLPAGTYRFQLADPDSSRRVVRVSDRDGSQSYGIFLSIPDQKLQPAADPVVMFKETPSGSPAAVQAWFYPGETYGYEFVYPHDQALKIAKAAHTSVLSMKDTPQTTTEEERHTAMNSAGYTRIDENDKPVSTDEALKDSSARRPSNTAANTPPAATAGSSPVNTQTSTSATTAGTPSTAQSATASQPAATTAQSTTARRSMPDRNRAVGTSGAQTPAPTDNAQANTASSRRLPKTAGELPLYELLSGLALAGSFGLRAFRRR